MQGLLRAIGTGLVLAVFIAGCGGEEEKAPAAPAEPAPAARQPAAAQPPRPAGQPAQPQARRSMGEELRSVSADLPGDYPEDAPVYPGSEVSRVRSRPDDSVIVVFRSEDPVADIHGWLLDGLPEQGWRIHEDRELSGNAIVQASKDGRSLNVIASKLDAGRPSEVTMITVTVQR